MGTLTDSLFSLLMGWVRGLVNALWALFSSDHTTVLEFLGRNWMLIAAVIIAAGLVTDLVIWMMRWQPYRLWGRAGRRQDEEEPDEDDAPPARAHAAVMPGLRRPEPQSGWQEAGQDGILEDMEGMYPAEGALSGEMMDHRADGYPQAGLVPDEQEEQRVMEQVRHAPDEYAYPGMRYDSTASRQISGGTQRYGVVTQEGPGAAEVARRRKEIDAWQQMQAEEQAAREAERERMAQEAAYRAEQERMAQEAARREEQERLEQERLAQEAYERELAEYERQRRQYERELAEYERQMAEYEAQTAREAKRQEQADELMPDSHATRRRRAAQPSYSDYVQGETVSELPAAPQWPQMADAAAQASEKGHAGAARKNRLLERVGKMMEAEEEELAVQTKLPPRVDMRDAYRPAVTPDRTNARKPKR